LVETAAKSLNVDHVSVWLYTDAKSRIACEDLYSRTTDTHAKAPSLSRSEFPAYFRAMDESRVIAAADAYTDPRTSEFAECYLDTNGVGAMLDAPIVVGGDCIGVVCHEHVGGKRDWTSAEQIFAGSIADFVALATEVFERRRSEAKLQAREEQLHQALHSASMALWEVAVDTGAIWHSEQLGPLLGQERGWQGSATSLLAVVHSDDQSHLRQLFRQALESTTTEFVAEYRTVWPNEEVHWLKSQCFVLRDDQGRPQRLTGTISNIDQRRRIEEEARHVTRMTEMGRLASSIAHDFNNLLTAVTGSAALLERTLLTTDDRSHAEVQHIFEATSRASALVSQLLAFGRKRPIKPKRIDFSALLTEVSDILRRLAGPQVDFSIDGADSPLYVFADASQLEQILVNLVVNAKDAMLEEGTLTITLTQEKAPPGLTFIADGPDVSTTPLQGLGYLVMRVRDTGPGIPATLWKDVFEPFFTTKGNAGSGLGLATSYGIAKQAGGDLLVGQSSSEGTTMALVLPLCPDLAHVP
jgi:PAS domain S-box-containing protein